MRRPNPKQFFRTIEQLYKERLNAFLALASRHVYNRDHAIDIVHAALAKSLDYFKKHPERAAREQIVHWLILKECKRKNKESREIPMPSTWFEEEKNANTVDGD